MQAHKYICASALSVSASEAPCEASDATATTSTALGYGLLIAAMAGDKELFHAVHEYRRTCINDLGLMHAAMQIHKPPIWSFWREDEHVPSPNGFGIRGSIFEGDCHAALGYAIAATSFKISDAYRLTDYANNSRGIVASLETRCIQPYTCHPMLGDIPDASGKGWLENAIVGIDYTSLTCPSDFLLLHFERIAKAVPRFAQHYTQMRDSCIATILDVTQRFSPQYGLLPDLLDWDAQLQAFCPASEHGIYPEGSKSEGCFSYMACKYPIQLAIYYYHSSDARVLPVMEKLASFYGQHANDTGLGSGYRLNGEVMAPAAELAFLVGGFAVSKVMQLPAADWYESAVRVLLSLESISVASIGWTEVSRRNILSPSADTSASSLPVSHPPPQQLIRVPEDAVEAAASARHAAQISRTQSVKLTSSQPKDAQPAREEFSHDALPDIDLPRSMGLGKTLLMLFQLECSELFDPLAMPRYPPNKRAPETPEETALRLQHEKLLSSNFDNEAEEVYRQALEDELRPKSTPPQ